MKSILSLLVCLGLIASCKSAPPEPDGFPVDHFSSDHAHTRYCGHYRFGDTWYYAPGHRHSGVCRHSLESGAWILK